ncbi:aminohydrolase [Mycobacterium tuberculosis]|nr:aminohydrolase [Mycobacterium tuberculosis]
MSRVHAFVDDALGDLDAVALADAIRSGRVGRADVVEAAIARAEAVNPALNALAYAAFDVARDAAAMGTGQEAFFSGVPTFIKDNVDVAGQPSMHGTDAWEPYAAVADSEITRVVLGTGLVSLGKTQLSEFGFSAVAEHPRLGPVRNPWNTD